MQLSNEWIIYSGFRRQLNDSNLLCPVAYILSIFISLKATLTVLQVNLNALSKLHLQMSEIIACFSGVVSTQYLFFFSWNHSERVIIVQNHFHLQIKCNVRQCDCMKTLCDPGCSMSLFSPVNLHMADHKKYKQLWN